MVDCVGSWTHGQGDYCRRVNSTAQCWLWRSCDTGTSARTLDFRVLKQVVLPHPTAGTAQDTWEWHSREVRSTTLTWPQSSSDPSQPSFWVHTVSHHLILSLYKCYLASISKDIMKNGKIMGNAYPRASFTKNVETLFFLISGGFSKILWLPQFLISSLDQRNN